MVHVQGDLRGNKKERSAIGDKRDAILSKRRRISTGLLNPTNYQSILASPISTSKPSNRTVFSDEPSFAQEKNDITSLSPLTSDITYKTIESIEIEDIFTKLMDFFVTPSLIDVDSVSSILYVSKVWNDLSSRAVVWKNTQRAQIIHRKRQIQNPLKLISDRLIGFRNLGQLKNSGTLTIHGQSFFVSERSTGRTYRLKVQRLEQSVGEEQRGGQQSRENCQDEEEWSSSKSVDYGADFECTVLPSLTFREIRAMEKLSAHHEVRTVQEGQRENQSHQLPCHVSTLKLWDIVHGYLLRWYDYTETTVTLSDYISEKQMLSSGDVKDIISKILLGVQDIHNCGLIHRNLTLETIWVSTLKHNEEVINGKSGVNSEMSIQIGDFEHCSNVVSADEPYTEVQNGHGISDTSGNLQPTSSLSSHTSTSLVFSGHQAPEIMITSNLLNVMPVDMWAIGCIFAKLLTLNKENQKNEPNWTMDVSKLLSLLTTSSNIREDQDGSKSGGYDEFFPESNFQIGREELHLLKRLICCNPSDRITASEALKHHLFDQSFSNYIITGKEVVLDRVRQYHKINSWKEAVSYSLDKVDKIERVHPRADQHAIIVDWLFEIVTVFEKDALTCFLAIDIMKLYCKNSSKKIKLKRLQMIAAACLHIASKCNDGTYISADDLSFCADKRFTANEILVQERSILSTIQWQISRPTIHDYVSMYLSLQNGTSVNHGDHLHLIAMYLSELAVQSDIFLKCSSHLIASLVIIVVRLNDAESIHIWPKEFEEISGLTLADLEKPLIYFCSLIENFQQINPNLKVISRRYRRDTRGRGIAGMRIKLIKDVTDIEAII